MGFHTMSDMYVLHHKGLAALVRATAGALPHPHAAVRFSAQGPSAIPEHAYRLTSVDMHVSLAEMTTNEFSKTFDFV